MNCKDVRAKLPLYAEGDLDDALELAIEAHLAGCSHCSDELSEVVESQRAVKALRSVPIDADAMAAMRQAVFERLAAERFTSRRRARSTRVIAAGAMAAAALVVVSGLATLWVTAPRYSSPMVDLAQVTHEDDTASADSIGAETVLIKWVTNNPDVVIYWMSEPRDVQSGPPPA